MPFQRGNLLGSAARQRKLTVEQVRQIKRIILLERWLRKQTTRTNAARGMYQRIADKFGVSYNQIKKIALRKRWRHVRADIHTERRKRS